MGSTSNHFKIRFRNQKSSTITKKCTCEVAIHFDKEAHVLSDFEFLILEQNVNSRDSYNNSLDERLLSRKLFGARNYVPSIHIDETERSELNSKNRIRYN